MIKERYAEMCQVIIIFVLIRRIRQMGQSGLRKDLSCLLIYSMYKQINKSQICWHLKKMVWLSEGAQLHKRIEL